MFAQIKSCKSNHCTKNEEILNGKLHFLCSEGSIWLVTLRLQSWRKGIKSREALNQFYFNYFCCFYEIEASSQGGIYVRNIMIMKYHSPTILKKGALLLNFIFVPLNKLTIGISLTQLLWLVGDVTYYYFSLPLDLQPIYYWKYLTQFFLPLDNTSKIL